MKKLIILFILSSSFLFAQGGAVAGKSVAQAIYYSGGNITTDADTLNGDVVIGGTIKWNASSIGNTYIDDDITLTNITQITTKPITSLSATNWRMFYSGAGAIPIELAFGDSGKYLMSNGASGAPTWETVSTLWTDDGTYTYLTQSVEPMELRKTGLAHGMTSISSTDAYANFAISDGSNGGLAISALADDELGADDVIMHLRAVSVDADPTTYAMVFAVGKKTGTTWTGYSGSQKGFAFRNSGAEILTISTDGIFGFGTNADAPYHMVSMYDSAPNLCLTDVGVNDNITSLATAQDTNAFWIDADDTTPSLGMTNSLGNAIGISTDLLGANMVLTADTLKGAPVWQGDLEVDGDLTYTLVHAYGAFEDSTRVIAVAQNTYSRVTNANGNLFATHADTVGITLVADSATIVHNGSYYFNGSFTILGSNTDTFKVALFKNGVKYLARQARFTSNDTRAIPISGYLKDLVGGDDISIRVTNTANGNDPTFVNGNMYLRKEHN